MTLATTRTTTYTVADVRRVLASFGADYAMIAQASNTHDADTVSRIYHDLKLIAEYDYLTDVKLVLLDSSDTIRRAAKYTISTSASGWSTEEPGNNLWPRLTGATLKVIATFSDNWWRMSPAERHRMRERMGLKYAWGLSDLDTSFVGMTSTSDRRYASNSFGMEKVLYVR